MKKTDNGSDLVIFDSYPTDVDAYIAKGVLETNGIPCIINNEIFSTVYPIGLSPWGSVKLLVFRRDLDAAREIMSRSPHCRPGLTPDCGEDSEK